MAKKRKASGKTGGADEVAGFEPRGGKHRAITTYEDVADSEDEFHINRDKVLLEEGPDAKRRRKYLEEDAGLAPSDDEVLGYSSSSDEDDEPAPSRPNSSKRTFSDDEEELPEEEEEEGWGASRKDYYSADKIQTEADALDEETEAKLLQQKKLQKMTDADFGFDETEWLDDPKEAKDEDADVVTEVLKDVEITPEMGIGERLRILQSRYPEFEFLADEFVTLQHLLVELQHQMDGETLGSSSTIVVKSRALASYMASLSMYFALLASTPNRALDPTELRDHPVMETLLDCRNLWAKVKVLKEVPTAINNASNSESEEEAINLVPSDISSQSSPPPTELSSKQARLAATEASFTDLDSLLPSRKSKSSKKPVKKTFIQDSDDNSDFGEQTHLTNTEASSKAARKKSLKFYTSQITQKSQKRMGAGRDAGGDEDLPYRERFRDRQMRLNAEAEARGRVLAASGRGKGKNTELGGDDSDDGKTGKEKREDNEDDEYYNLITSRSSSKKVLKANAIVASKDAADASALARIAPEGDLDDDAKRAIGYTIEKNKGLAPKRKKDVRNPRVKKRKKFEEKKKKLGSVRAVYKGGEERGGYGGEKTGIKSGLVKSVKL